MATVWPFATGPQAQLFNDAQHRYHDTRVRTPMESGILKMRQGVTTPPRIVTTRMVLTGTQLATFNTFFEGLQYGVDSFEWKSPEATAAGADDTEYVFEEVPVWTNIAAGPTPADNIYEAILQLRKVGDV